MQRGVKYPPFRTVQCSESLLSPLQGGRETAALQKASKRDFRHYNNRALTVPFSQGAKQESASYNNNPKGGFAPIQKKKATKNYKNLLFLLHVVFALQYYPQRIFAAIKKSFYPWRNIALEKITCRRNNEIFFQSSKTLDSYIVDFYCKPLNLVIEVDGSYHHQPAQVTKDKERQQILESMNLNFLRFSEQQVRKYMEMVVIAIQNYIVDYEEKHPEVKAATKRYKLE